MTGGADGGRPLRVAIAGCHRMLERTPGSHNHAADFAAVPETAVVAVFDRGAETRDAFLRCWDGVWGAITPYDDFARMLDEVRPDVVCVATRQTMHAEQVTLATAAGVRGVLCEKPLATSLEEADRILGACRGAGIPLAYALSRRWEPRYLSLRAALADGAVGAVSGVTAYAVPNLINHGPHWYDVLLALAGDPEPEWASGLLESLSGESPDSRRRLDPAGQGLVGLAGGGLAGGGLAGGGLAGGAVGYVTPAGGPGLAFEVTGDRGRLLALNDARQVYLWERAGGGGGPGPAGLAPAPRPIPVPPEAGYVSGPALVRDLVRAVRTGGRTACDVEEARRATEIGFALHASSAVGGARVGLPVPGRGRRIPSLPWGNE